MSRKVKTQGATEEMSTQSSDTDKVQLKPEVGLTGATSLVIGMIIGSGIFISPKGVLRATGSVGLCLLVWIFAGVIQLGASLCHAELGAMIQRSGGSYTYLRMGLGNPLAFAFVLKSVIVVGPGVLVILLLTFAKYTITLLPTCGSPVYLEKFIAAAATATIVVVNSYSTKLAARVAIITTIGKLSALLVIVVGGMVLMSQGITHELLSGFSDTSNDPSSLALALYSAQFSYGGGESLNNLVEEIKNPSKNLPRAAVLSVLTVIVVYTLTNISYLAVMTKAELLNAEAVAVVFGERVLGRASVIIPLAVMVSTFGAANNLVLSGSRLVFAAARDKNIPDVLSYIQVNQLTPMCATILMVTCSFILLVLGDVGTLINFLGFLSSFFSVCVYVCFLIFRLKAMKDAPRPVKVPLVIPVLLLLLNLYLFLAPLVISPQLEYVYAAIGVVSISALLYVLFIYFRVPVPFYDRLVLCIQLTLNVCPPSKSLDSL